MSMRILLIILACEVIGFANAFGTSCSIAFLDSLARADCIVLAKAQDVRKTEGRTLSYQVQGVKIASFKSLKGPIPEVPLETDGQLFPAPSNAQGYLIFLKQNDERNKSQENDRVFRLFSNCCSIIGVGSLMEFERSDFEDEQAILRTVCKMLIAEQDAGCALLQSYMLTCYRNSELGPKLWPALQKRANDPDEFIRLAVANVGVRVIGADALEPITSVPFSSYDKKRQDDFELFCARNVRWSIGNWAEWNANRANALRILNYALTCKGDDKAGLVKSVAKHLDVSAAPLIAPLLQSPQETVPVQYACMQAVMYMFNEGRGIITFEAFKTDPKNALIPAIDLLKQNHLWSPN